MTPPMLAKKTEKILNENLWSIKLSFKTHIKFYINYKTQYYFHKVSRF